MMPVMPSIKPFARNQLDDLIQPWSYPPRHGSVVLIEFLTIHAFLSDDVTAGPINRRHVVSQRRHPARALQHSWLLKDEGHKTVAGQTIHRLGTHGRLHLPDC